MYGGFCSPTAQSGPAMLDRRRHARFSSKGAGSQASLLSWPRIVGKTPSWSIAVALPSCRAWWMVTPISPSWRRLTLSKLGSCRWRSTRFRQCTMLAVFSSAASRPAWGASSAKPRLDIAIRNEIKAGRIPGPRLLASTPEITVTGGLGDERLLHMYRESFAVVIDGAEDIRRYVRTMSREGCDIIKLNISGNQTVPN